MERRCIERCNISRSAYLSKFHQILHLRRRSDPWTSPSTAPASKFWLKKTSVQEKPSRVLLQSKVADLSPETAARTRTTQTMPEPEPSSARFWRRKTSLDAKCNHTWKHGSLNIPKLRNGKEELILQPKKFRVIFVWESVFSKVLTIYINWISWTNHLHEASRALMSATGSKFRTKSFFRKSSGLKVFLQQFTRVQDNQSNRYSVSRLGGVLVLVPEPKSCILSWHWKEVFFVDSKHWLYSFLLTQNQWKICIDCQNFWKTDSHTKITLIFWVAILVPLCHCAI